MAFWKLADCTEQETTGGGMQGDAYLQTEGGGRTEKITVLKLPKAKPARPYGKGKAESVGMCRP